MATWRSSRAPLTQLMMSRRDSLQIQKCNSERTSRGADVSTEEILLSFGMVMI